MKMNATCLTVTGYFCYTSIDPSKLKLMESVWNCSQLPGMPFQLYSSFMDGIFSLLPQDYQLPNQPVHTVDINIVPSHLRPHPPMNRTQSSPSLYSSNLLRSPLGARRKTSTSAKVTRPPTSGEKSEEGLPPRPPARGVRRPLELNPVFSSGTSWRKRKWLKWSVLNAPHYLQTNYVTW